MTSRKISLRGEADAPRETGWKLPLMLGIIVPFLFWGVFRYVHPPVDARLAAVANKEGWNAQEYSDVMGLMDKVGQAGELDQKDWNRLMQILQDPNIDMRDYALSTLANMTKSRRREEIVNIGKIYLNAQNPTDKNHTLQSTALILLWKMKDLSWREEVDRRRNTTNPLMRHTIDLIVSQENGK